MAAIAPGTLVCVRLGLCHNLAGNFSHRRSGGIFRLVGSSFAADLLLAYSAERLHGRRRGVAHCASAAAGSAGLLPFRRGVGRVHFSSRSHQLSPGTAFLGSRSGFGAMGTFPFLSHFRLGMWLALGVLELLGCRQM